MYLINIPKWQRWFFPGAIFSKKEENIVYLTFDDGPNTGITDDVLTILESYNAKATFFCIGKNVQEPVRHQTLNRVFSLQFEHEKQHPLKTICK